MHPPHQFWGIRVLLPFVAKAVQACVAELRSRRSKAGGVADYAILEQIVQRFSAKRTAGIFEEFVAHGWIEADGFKYLTISVTAHSRDPHPRQHFPQTILNRPAKARDSVRTPVIKSIEVGTRGQTHGQVRMH